MKSCIYILLFVMFIVPSRFAGADEPPDSAKTKAAEGMSNPTSYKDIMAECERISTMPDEQLTALLIHPADSVALASAWERVRRTIDNDKRDRAPLDKLAVSRFLGFLEGRIRCPLPPQWDKNALAGYSDGRHRIAFSQRYVAPTRKEAGDSKTSWSHFLRCTREADQWVITDGPKRWSIVVGDDNRGLMLAEVLTAGSKTYIALYDSGQSRYAISAFDDAAGTLKWTALVLSGIPSINVQGQTSHLVDMTIQHGDLIVFGNCGSSLYVEVFDLKDGSAKAKFSSACFK